MCERSRGRLTDERDEFRDEFERDSASTGAAAAERE
jgi:hypothetical protein